MSEVRQTLLRIYICRCGHRVSARTHDAAQEALETHWQHFKCLEIFDVLDDKNGAIAEMRHGKPS